MLNKKQKDLILQCAINICTECDYKDTCQDILECNNRMTLEGLSEGFNYIISDRETFGETEESKEFSYDNPFYLTYDVI